MMAEQGMPLLLSAVFLQCRAGCSGVGVDCENAWFTYIGILILNLTALQSHEYIILIKRRYGGLSLV